MRRHERARGLALLLVVLAHLALLLWWAAQRPPPVATAAARVTLRLLPPVVQAPQRDSAPPVSTPARVAPSRTAATRPTPAAPRVVPDAAARPDSGPEPITITRTEPAASQPATAEAAPPSLLDGDATRRAIRASARDPGLAAQAGRIGPAVATPEQQLGSGIAQGARGDCLKGEYFGGGAGLLSLPFLAAAALRDQCRQ